MSHSQPCSPPSPSCSHCGSGEHGTPSKLGPQSGYCPQFRPVCPSESSVQGQKRAHFADSAPPPSYDGVHSSSTVKGSKIVHKSCFFCLRPYRGFPGQCFSFEDRQACLILLASNVASIPALYFFPAGTTCLVNTICEALPTVLFPLVKEMDNSSIFTEHSVHSDKNILLLPFLYQSYSTFQLPAQFHEILFLGRQRAKSL